MSGLLRARGDRRLYDQGPAAIEVPNSPNGGTILIEIFVGVTILVGVQVS